MKHTGIQASVHDDGTIMIYGFVGDQWEELDAKTIIDKILALGPRDELNVHIQSGGGYIFEGLAIYNFLNSYEGEVIVHIDGLAASMASIIAMAGDKILMPENALLMIHNPWNVSVGDAEQLRKDANILEKTKDSLISIYVDQTGLSTDEVSTLMDAETWFSANDAVDQGFATEVTGKVEMAACIQGVKALGDRFTNIPDSLTGVAVVAAIPPPKLNSGGSTTLEDENMKTDEELKAEKAAADKAHQAAIDKANADGARAERKRQESIRAACTAAKLKPEHADKLVNDGVNVEDARETIIGLLVDENNLVPINTATHLTSGDDVSDKFRAGAELSILARVGLADDDMKNEFRGLNLRELARESLNVVNAPVRGMSAMQMVAAAFTHSTGDFPLILSNIANKAMLKGWDEADENFQAWTTPGVLTDFKSTTRVDLNSFPSLREVRAGAEYKYATMGERGESIILLTYGELFSIDRQAIINDDLNAFTKIPRKMGRAATRTVGDLVIGVVTANAAMADGIALFHASHNNLAGTGAAPTTLTVQAGKAAMMTQTDGGSNAHALNIRPAYFLVPATLDGTARVIMESETQISASQNNSKVPNSVRGMAEVITEPRLDADSTTAWYLIASGSIHDTIEVAYLDGNAAPMLDEKEGWGVDGVEFKVRIDAGVKALDFRTMYKNAGA